MLATLGLGALTWGLTAWSATDRLGNSAALDARRRRRSCSPPSCWVEQRRGAKAMVPLALFGSRAFVGLTLFTFLLYGALGGLMLLLPYMLIEARALSGRPWPAWRCCRFPIIIAVGSPLMGKLAARIGPRWPLSIGPAAGRRPASRWRSGSTTRASYWTTVLPPILAVSAGMAIAVAPLTTAVLSSVDEHHVGTASGLNSAVSRSGGLIAVALLGVVLSQQGAALIAGFHGAALAGAALALLSSLTAFATLGGARVRPSRGTG